MLIEGVLVNGISMFQFYFNMTLWTIPLNCFGFILNQEYSIIIEVKWNSNMILLLLLLAAVASLYYFTTACFIAKYGGTFYSIGANGGVVYSMLLDVYLMSRPFKWIVIPAFAIIVTGSIIFEWKPP